MVRLESLELFGFKSFADKTSVQFTDGITGVIGPNGCGKSNLSDAIGFVLGAQTAKNLRGQRMDDFIFGGTAKRRQSGMAEVRLRLRRRDEEPIVLDGIELDSDTLDISRRIYRSGESHYLINQRRCRLMDVQKFMTDAGLGFAPYAMIAQGRIDGFLTARPLDRRALIEEAAQITGYKAKRRNAEMKIELAQQNLLRVNDIIVEIERQLRSLKRQASKTRRYKILKEEFRALQKKRFALESQRFEETYRKLSEGLRVLREQNEALQKELFLGEKTYREALEKREELQNNLNALQERRSNLNLELDRTKNSIVYHQQQISQTEEAATALASERQILEQSLQDLETEWIQFQESGLSLEEEVKLAEAAVEEHQQLVYSQNAEVDRVEEKLEELRNRLVRITAESASIANLKEQASQRIRRVEAERERIQQEWDKTSSRAEEATAQWEQKKATLEELKEQLEEIRQIFEEKKTLKVETARILEELTAEENDFRSRLIALNERLQSLQELELSRSHYSEGVQQVLKHLTKSQVVTVGGTLADSLETSPEFERLVEEFLDEELEFILVDSMDEAMRGLTELRGLKSGKCTFFSLKTTNGFGPGEKNVSARAKLPEKIEGVFGTISDIVKLKPSVREAFARVLPERAEAIVVSDIEKATQLAHSYPENTFITLAGESLAPRGLVSGTAAESAKLGLLGLKRQRKDLEKKVTAQQAALAEVTKKRESARIALNELSLEIEKLQSELYQLEKRIIGLGHECDQSQEDVRRLERALKSYDFDIERLDAEHQELTARLQSTGSSATELEVKRVETEGELATNRERLQEKRLAFGQAQERFNNVSAQLKVLHERRLAHTRTLERIKAQRAEMENRIKTSGHRQEQARQRIEELTSELKGLRERSQELQIEAEAFEEKVLAAQATFTACRENLQVAEAAVSELRERRSALQEERSALDVEKARTETQIQNLQEHCLDQLGLPLVEAVEDVDLTDDDPEEIHRRHERLKETLENFGPINMTALQEYQESEERFNFLSSQKKDIEESIADTTKAIQEINRRSRAKFREAFEAVNANFKVIFEKLFGGGECGMQLLDEDDILECGIDIFAQPPGKRLQNVMLLSGGEKALTVFALLVGVFMFRPSRFCVLDEVDAPLDDANVRRFGKLIEEMSKETQFIIVTHNKRTMEIADALFGITMEEAGVSKVVSAQF